MHAYQECDWETRVLDKCAIELGDKVKIEPVSGPSRKFYINRTAIDFISENFRGETGCIVKKIPSMKGDTIFLRMEGVEQKNHRGHLKRRYLLKSMNGRPFWHNGSLVFSIVLTDGDEVEIGYNRLKFMKERGISRQELPEIEKYSKIIRSNIPILIEGETGTGKTTLAQKLHQASGREGEFVHINLSAFSENLLESELFGHVKGAFTGAVADKAGAIVRANKGTLFLDEIDSISISTQVKLLLFLDNYSVTPVGGSTSRKVDCRIIFASGSKLKDLVENKKLRLDFFHRVSSGQSFKLPSLSEKPESIVNFCQEFEHRHNVIIEKRLKDFYQTVHWTGNYRQLQGHLERKRLLAAGYKVVWGKEDEELMASKPAVTHKEDEIISLEDLKDSYCIRVYYRCQQKVGITAKKLEISEKCLRRILQKRKVR